MKRRELLRHLNNHDCELIRERDNHSAFGRKIVHEFEEQRRGGFHQSRPASLKLI
jgi:hypothetical protein